MVARTTTRTAIRGVAAVLGPAAIGFGALTGAGTAAAVEPAQEDSPAPRILEIELDLEDTPPTLELEFVDLQGDHREIAVDLQTGRIVEDEPQG